MTHRILALHRVDLAPAAQLAAQMARDLVGQPPPVVTTIDPVLHTYALATGQPDVELLPLAGSDTVAADAQGQALAAARLLSAQADEVMAEFIPEAQGAAWCTFWIRCFYATAYGNRGYGKLLAKALGDDTVHLLLPDLPYRYGYHSFVPGLSVFGGLTAAGRGAKLYSSPMPPWDATLLPDPASAPDVRAPDLLCHIPTCFADSALFTAELQAAGRRVLVLPSQYFDVPTGELPRCEMVPPERLAERLPRAQQAALEAVLDRLGAMLAQQLAPVVNGAALLHKQVQAFVDGFRSNALLFLALEDRFGSRLPRTLLITNHDVGLHGAQISFAQRHGLQTIMVPHSKIFNGVVQTYRQEVLCLTHAMQGGEVIDLEGRVMPTGTLDFAKPVTTGEPLPKPLAVLGIVLNSLSANALCLVDVAAYLQGLRQLLAWCDAQQVQCRIRCRPNGSVMQMLIDSLGLRADDLLPHQEGSMLDHARGCDLVLSYDIPTSGAFDLLEAGIPVLQTLCRRLEPEEARMANATVVPQLPVAEVIGRLQAYAADPLGLWQFRREQTAQYLRAHADALPLRAWLTAERPRHVRRWGPPNGPVFGG